MKNTIKKIVILALAIVMAATCLVSCEFETTVTDEEKTLSVAKTLKESQPTPTDINYSLERYNLIRRAYWVNGQREKANTLVCEIEKPLGYIVLFIGNTTVGSFVVDGKVSSLNSYLTPDSEVYSSGYTEHVEWLADVDGSYGANDNGIFFFDVMGNYIEWTGTYLYTDIPMTINDPAIKFDVNYD